MSPSLPTLSLSLIERTVLAGTVRNIPTPGRMAEVTAAHDLIKQIEITDAEIESAGIMRDPETGMMRWTKDQEYDKDIQINEDMKRLLTNLMNAECWPYQYPETVASLYGVSSFKFRPWHHHSLITERHE